MEMFIDIFWNLKWFGIIGFAAIILVTAVFLRKKRFKEPTRPYHKDWP